jgi:hypothetical protein
MGDVGVATMLYGLCHRNGCLCAEAIVKTVQQGDRWQNTTLVLYPGRIPTMWYRMHCHVHPINIVSVEQQQQQQQRWIDAGMESNNVQMRTHLRMTIAQQDNTQAATDY